MLDPVELTENFPTLKHQVEQLREFITNPQERARTGVATLDSYIDGPAAGEIVLLLGRSYTGKSMLIHNMMLNTTASPGYLVFSMEMPARALLQRMASAWMGVSHVDFLNQTARGSMSERVFDMANDFDHHAIAEDPMTLDEMSAYLFVYRQWYGHQPKAVIIDYLELIQTDNVRASGWERTENLARELKVWAKKEAVPIYLVHQSNMRVDSWSKPDEASARGGGFREADIVVGIHKPSRDPALTIGERQDLHPVVRLDVLKNRINGKENYAPIELELAPSLRMTDMKASADVKLI